jgi:hypothetical protein
MRYLNGNYYLTLTLILKKKICFSGKMLNLLI